MIKSLKLKFGRGPNSEAEEIPLTPVTVFVGPNNSGKSKILNELNAFCIRGNQNTSDVIFSKIEFEESSEEEAERRLQKISLEPLSSETLHENYEIFGKRGLRFNISRSDLKKALEKPNDQTNSFCSFYLRLFTLILDGTHRISLTGAQSAGDLQKAPENSLRVLFDDNLERAKVRSILKDAFGNFLVIDPTNIGKLRLRLSSREPANEREEKGWDSESVKFHSEAQPIEDTSDGVKAFTGIIIEVIAGDPYVLLIDEPEAFLHPSLSFKLGKEIATTTRDSEKRIFVATHSAKFLMGCIQSGAPVTIVRLTYRQGVPTARVLRSEEISRLMRNPLLRSTGVLEALFYEFVVVTEADTDRALYQEINERLLTSGPESGIPNCLFINAQNKQTVPTIVKPLRDLGIPTVGLVDIDVLKEGGGVWTNFLKCGSIPAIEHQPLGTVRSNLKNSFEATGKEMKRDGGIDLLSNSDKEAASNLFDHLAAYGLFVVRKGELESWLRHLNVPGHGPDWLIQIFEKMGEDPDSPSYLRPSVDDVWEFMGQIREWLVNPKRKGIPE